MPRRGAALVPATEPRPISLSDDQLLFLADLVGPLHPNNHRAFLQLLAAALRYEQEPIGDGILHREARELFARFFRPPALSAPRPAGHERATRLTSAAPIA